MAINQLLSTTGKTVAAVVAQRGEGAGRRCHANATVRPSPHRRALPWWHELTTLLRLSRFCSTVV